MWIKFLHLIGLTNLSDSQVVEYARARGNAYFTEMLEWRQRAARAESLLAALGEGKDLRRASHVRDLGERIKKLRRQVREMQIQAEWKNRELYATGLIVNCTGCEAGAPFQPQHLTEEKVRQVEQIARRLRTWWDTHNWRAKRGLIQAK